MKRTFGTVAAGLAAAAVAGAAWGASPPSTATGSGAFQACLKAHGVTLGKTTDQTKIRQAFVACRSSNPNGGGFGQRRQLTAAQRTELTKYFTCLSKHGVKIRFGFRPGQRPNGQGATGQRPTRPRTIPKNVLAAQKACASVRPAFMRAFGQRPPATAGA
jgi:hypothetical protein